MTQATSGTSRLGGSAAPLQMLVLMLALALTACAPAAPSPTASAATDVPSPTVTSSTTPTDTTVTTPMAAFNGDCDRLLQDPGVVGVIGAAEEIASSERWWLGFRTAGGLPCAFRSEGGSGFVLVLPAATAGSGDDAEPGCRRTYDAAECADLRVIGDLRVFAVFSFRDDQPTGGPEVVPAVVSEFVDAVGAAVAGDPVAPVTVSSDTLALPVDCQVVAEAADVTTLLENPEIFPTRIEEGAGPIERRLAEEFGLAGRCDWSELDEFREFGVVVYPNAAWAWREPALAATLDAAEERAIAGWEAFTSFGPYGASILASDGTNIVEVTGRGIDDPQLVSAAERVLAAVSGR